MAIPKCICIVIDGYSSGRYHLYKLLQSLKGLHVINDNYKCYVIVLDVFLWKISSMTSCDK